MRRPVWPEFQRAEERAQSSLSLSHLTVDDIKGMSMEEYARIRGRLMGAAMEDQLVQAEKEAVGTTCMWCGKGGWPDVDAHEAECEG